MRLWQQRSRMKYIKKQVVITIQKTQKNKRKKIDIAEANFKPSYGIQALYKQREPENNFVGDDWLSVQASISVPLWSKNIKLQMQPFREHPEDLNNILVLTPQGQHIPLGELAKIAFIEGPAMIKSENARLTGWVFVDIGNRDIDSYIKDAQTIVRNTVDLPAGYAIEWSGQFEQVLEAKKQLSIAIPAVGFAIFTLLMLYFSRIDRTLMVMLSLPVAMVGGMWVIYLADYNLSVAVGVGFIAVGGLAVETACIMIVYIDLQVRESQPENLEGLKKAIFEGALLRIRPVLMTVITEFAGLLPIFIFTGLGADVMRRIALPMIGGMITTTLLTLIVIPVIYYLWEAKQLKKVTVHAL